jgi:GNAT superfamily N-acetyltransferase
VTIRTALVTESDAIRAVERSAGERFSQIGMDWVASHEPMNAEDLCTFAADGRSWVAEDDDSDERELIGYVIVEVVDDCAHIEQLSVAIDHQGEGIGRALVETAEAWAVANGLGGVSLTTFRDVVWNRPLYEHFGYRVLDPDELTGELSHKCEDERLLGLERSPRVAMRKDLAKGA